MRTVSIEIGTEIDQNYFSCAVRNRLMDLSLLLPCELHIFLDFSGCSDSNHRFLEENFYRIVGQTDKTLEILRKAKKQNFIYCCTENQLVFTV